MLSALAAARQRAQLDELQSPLESPLESSGFGINAVLEAKYGARVVSFGRCRSKAHPGLNRGSLVAHR